MGRGVACLVTQPTSDSACEYTMSRLAGMPWVPSDSPAPAPAPIKVSVRCGGTRGESLFTQRLLSGRVKIGTRFAIVVRGGAGRGGAGQHANSMPPSARHTARPGTSPSVEGHGGFDAGRLRGVVTGNQ